MRAPVAGRIESGTPPPGTNTFRDYASATGDASFSSKTHHVLGGAAHGLEQMRYYYGPDGRMRAMQRYGRWWDPTTQVPSAYDDVWEEYIYDALGRRIVKYTEYEPFCGTRCAPCSRVDLAAPHVGGALTGGVFALACSIMSSLSPSGGWTAPGARA
jgi:hypothetical protein